MKMKNDDVFVPKPRKGSKVCEDCSGVRVAKLRPIMNQCSTLYFTCQTFDLLIRDTNDINVYDAMKSKVETLTEAISDQKEENKKLSQQVQTLDGHQASLKALLEERENSLQETETKLASLEQVATEGSAQHGGNIEALINKRFDKIDKNIDAMIENKLAGVLGIPISEASTSDNKKKLFSSVVGGVTGPENHVTALKTTKKYRADRKAGARKESEQHHHTGDQRSSTGRCFPTEARRGFH